MRELAMVGLMLVVGLVGSPVQAQVCLPKSPSAEASQAAVKYLRRLSLDLRGQVPTYSEMLTVAKQGYVDDKTIDNMLKSAQFTTQMREFFKDLLTLNIQDLRLQGGFRAAPYTRIDDNGKRVTNARLPHTIVIDRGTSGARVIMRGGDLHCKNKPAKFDSQKRLLCDVVYKDGTKAEKPCITAYDERRSRTAPKPNTAQEGYMMVRPYWEATKQVKVCGLAALKEANPVVGSTTYQCSTHNSNNDPKPIHQILCGCGPNLDWCFRGGDSLGGHKSMNAEVLGAMMEQTLRLVDYVVNNNRPYTDILLSKRGEINGPISHFINVNPRASNRITLPSRTEMTVPKLAYTNTKWTSYTRGARESGILTMPFYLLKYATNRGRLHRYHNAFLCSYFVPPAGGLPDANNACHKKANLMDRCGCQHCHQTIEPEAAHWGRWQEGAWFPLLPTAYKLYDEKCDSRKTKSNPAYCRNLYLRTANHSTETQYQGNLLSYVFANEPIAKKLGADFGKAIATGPEGLVQRDIKSGTIAKCGVKKLYSWFVGQDLQDRQVHLHDALTQQFMANNYNVRDIVKAIVRSEEYRRGFTVNTP